MPDPGKPADLEPKHAIYHVEKINNGPKELSVILTQDSEGDIAFRVNGKIAQLKLFHIEI